VSPTRRILWAVVTSSKNSPTAAGPAKANPANPERIDAINQVFALLDRCPHKGGPLSQGIVFGTSVACPLHNWTIGLADGCAQGADSGCTPRFAVRIENGMVCLNAQELEQLALDAQAPLAGPANQSC
jgi:nitrite reductase (NADH) small subunit